MISVIVPIFNTEKYLPKCIESIINQTYSDLEIIVVNDGSTDGCSEICNQYSNTDNRIKVIHKENGGVSSSRNVGIEASSGEFIQFVDSDDYLDPNMCQVLLENQKRTNSDIVICGYKHVGVDGGKIYNSGIEYNGSLQEFGTVFGKMLTLNLLNSPCNKLFRRTMINVKFPENMVVGEDLVFNLNYLKNVRSICSVADTPYNYVYNVNSITSRGKYIPINETEWFYINIKKFCDMSFHKYDVEPIYRQFVDSVFYTVQRICESSSEYALKKDLLVSCFSNQLLRQIYSEGSFYSDVEKRMVCGYMIRSQLSNSIILYFLLRDVIKRVLNLLSGSGKRK